MLLGTNGRYNHYTITIVEYAMRFIDRTGQRFGKLVAQRYVGPRKWEFLCDCGKTSVADIGNVTKGRTTSCGCVSGHVKPLEYHGMHGTPEYSAWSAMVTRATNPNMRMAHRYSGRGITVCDLWRNSFSAFYAEVGPRPSPKHSIDRIDNDKGYHPGNVRWATDTEQMLNRSNNALVTVGGVTKAVSEWAREKGINRTTLDARIARGVPEANLFDPVRAWGKGATR